MGKEKPVEVPAAVLVLLTLDPKRAAAVSNADWPALRDEIGRFTGTPVEDLDRLRSRR